jgi:hypothetical protein
LAPSRWLVLQARLGLPLAALAVRVVSLTRVLRQVSPPINAQTDPILARGIQSALEDALAAGPYRGNCLSQSLTLLWLLRRQGLQGDLRIGVRREAGQFLAHAWVEHANVPLNEAPGIGRAYAAFDRPILPTGARWT